jgi:hypothetical protein
MTNVKAQTCLPAGRYQLNIKCLNVKQGNDFNARAALPFVVSHYGFI